MANFCCFFFNLIHFRFVRFIFVFVSFTFPHSHVSLVYDSMTIRELLKSSCKKEGEFLSMTIINLKIYKGLDHEESYINVKNYRNKINIPNT